MRRRAFEMVIAALLASAAPGDAQPIPVPPPAKAPPTTASGSAPTRNEIMAARATPARRVQLANGMTVLLKESPAHDFVAVEMLCQVGLQNEETPQAGLIALWEKLLQDRLDEVLAQRTAGAAVGQADDVVLDADDQIGVDVHGPEVIHQHRNVARMIPLQDVIDKGGLAGAQEPGKDRQWNRGMRGR